MIDWLRSNFSRYQLAIGSLLSFILLLISIFVLIKFLNVHDGVAFFIALFLFSPIGLIFSVASQCNECGKIPMRTSHFGSSSTLGRIDDFIQNWNRFWPETTCSRCDTDLTIREGKNDQ